MSLRQKTKSWIKQRWPLVTMLQEVWSTVGGRCKEDWSTSCLKENTQVEQPYCETLIESTFCQRRRQAWFVEAKLII